MNPRDRRRRAGRLLATAAVAAAALAVPGVRADAGATGGVVSNLLGTVGTTLDGTLGLVVGDGFQLGLFNEFEPQGTPVPLSQVKAAIGTGGLERAGNDGTGIDVALIDTGVVPVAGLDRGDVVAHGPDLSFDQQAGLAPGLDG